MSHVIALSKGEREKFAQEHHGLLTRVAKRCHVSHSLVSRVLHGTNTSKRVDQAIDAEIRRELRKMQKQHERWAAKLAGPAKVTEPESGPEAAVA
jgi:hypothetical protein